MFIGVVFSALAFYSPKISQFSVLFGLSYSFIHESNRKNQYVFTLSALAPKVYILAYDFDLHSVLVLFNASLTSSNIS